MAESIIIINEFLTFVQNKIDVIDELSVTQICASNFTEGEIEDGKSVLFGSLSLKCVQRKGEDKSKKNIRDVIKAFKDTDPSKQPVFVAKDLNRLPPVTFDYVDVSRLVKDLIVLKNELQNVRESSVSKQDMSTFEARINTELIDIRSSVNNSASKKSIPYGVKNKDDNRAVSRTSPPISQQPMAKQCVDSSVHLPTCTERECEILTATVVDAPSYRDVVNNVAKLSANEQLSIINDDGFTYVDNKKKRARNRNMRGTATESCRLLVADIPDAVYLSRLKNTTTIEDIKEHILSLGEHCMDVQILPQRQETSFRSFKIVVPKHKLSTFLSAGFWPSGSIFRRFRERTTNVNKSA